MLLNNCLQYYYIFPTSACWNIFIVNCLRLHDCIEVTVKLNCGYIHIWDVRAGQVTGLPQYVVIQTNYLLLCSKVELILLVVIISYICYLCQVCQAMFISQIC